MTSVGLIVVVILVILLLAVLLHHLSPLDRRSVVTNGAAHGSPYNGVMCEVSSNAPNYSAL